MEEKKTAAGCDVAEGAPLPWMLGSDSSPESRGVELV